MKKVLATGVFDLLHPGHLYYLQKAKKLGDKLVVVVACDATVRKMKHEPITPERMRLEMVRALKVVDEAHLGYEGDPYKIVEKIKPDIVALGYDQTHNPEEIEKGLAKRGLKVQVIRLPKYEGSDLNGTRKIVGRIISAYEFQKNMERIERGKK